MTNVVAFRSPSRNGSVTAVRRTEPAQILFFTGVRYVRDEDGPSPAMAAGRKPAASGAVPDAGERLQA